MKRWRHLKSETRRAFCDGIKFSKIKKRQHFSSSVSTIPCPSKCVDVNALEWLVFQCLRISFQIGADD
jgi:hypothetical protein